MTHIYIKTAFIYLLNFIIFLNAFAQKPDFTLQGFGKGTVGGQGGAVVTVSTYDALVTAVQGTDKKIIQISGKITAPGGGAIIDVGSNKSIIGLGDGAFLSMINLHLKNSQQIIIQNITSSMIGSTLGSDADLISIETTSSNEVKYIWIDHCEFYNVRPTLPESASKKDLYDGMVDIKKSSSLITISWCYFHDHWKCSLIGYTATDTYDRKITYHHNYFKNIKSRVPSYRGGTGHLYNNYFDGLTGADAPSSDAVNSRENACLKVESNYFKNYVQTIYCALDDVVEPGFAYGDNNIFDNSPQQTASPCSSFSPPYSYTVTPAAEVPAQVVAWSGVGKLGLVTGIDEQINNETKFTSSPLPFFSEVTVGFTVEEGGQVILILNDALGRVVFISSPENVAQGRNVVRLNLSSLPAGTYYCTISGGTKVETGMLLKD